MTEKNFILHCEFNKSLTNKEFDKAKKKYLESLDENNYSIKSADTIYELIENVKRAREKIGPYQNISVFESLNRIGSDLVLLDGAEKLFNGAINDIVPDTIHLKMGTTHGFDFVVKTIDGKTIYGEAFNAAESFCKFKMRQAIHKLIDNNPDKERANSGIIFINEEVQTILSKYSNKKEEEKNTDFTIYKIYCGRIK